MYVIEFFFFFFFQAEDGIRDFHVTGVQTCALPIWRRARRCWSAVADAARCRRSSSMVRTWAATTTSLAPSATARWRSCWSPHRSGRAAFSPIIARLFARGRAGEERMTTIAVIRGDGIGPEIMDACLRVLDALGAGLSYEFADAGMTALEKHGELLPQDTLDAIARHRVALKGPLTTPIGGGFSSLNVELRKRFDLYANVRPALSMPGTKAHYENIDIITVREDR